MDDLHIPSTRTCSLSVSFTCLWSTPHLLNFLCLSWGWVSAFERIVFVVGWLVSCGLKGRSTSGSQFCPASDIVACCELCGGLCRPQASDGKWMSWSCKLLANGFYLHMSLGYNLCFRKSVYVRSSVQSLFSVTRPMLTPVIGASDVPFAGLSALIIPLTIFTTVSTGKWFLRTVTCNI